MCKTQTYSFNFIKINSRIYYYDFCRNCVICLLNSSRNFDPICDLNIPYNACFNTMKSILASIGSILSTNTDRKIHFKTFKWHFMHFLPFRSVK